jgi:hypothetical protein
VCESTNLDTEDIYPDLKDTPCLLTGVKGRLSEVLPKVWDRVEESYLESLWRSIPSLIAAIIAAEGWDIKY